jgi:hypothetical protein
MRPLPAYPPYRQIHAPNGKRWLAAAAALLLATVGTCILMRPPESGYGLLLGGIFCVGVVCSVIWGARILYYRTSLHNACLYRREIEQVQKAWWEKHRQHVALQEAVLLGPAGANVTQWHRLINRDHRQPEVRNESGGKVLRLQHSFTTDTAERETQLAKMLVLQWFEQRKSEQILRPLRCYWQGSETAWLAFSAQMALTFPKAVLPEQPILWRGEESMAAIVEELNHSAAEDTVLCAGCCSIPGSPNSELPAGEAAVLWLLGKTGKVQFSRGEVFDADIDESIVSVARRTLIQSEIEQPPDSSFLFSQNDIPDLNKTGWNITQHVQDLNWGSLAELESMVVQTLAAFFAERNDLPCGWLARDPHHTLALGIVKPYGSGN